MKVNTEQSKGSLAHNERSSDDGANVVRALERGLRVLKCFDIDHPSWHIADLSRAVGLHRATTRRLLKTLENDGFVIIDPSSGEYRLGAAFLPLVDLVHMSRAHSQLVRIAHPHLLQLMTSTQETVGISVWVDEGVLDLDHSETTQSVKPTLLPGKVSTTYGTTHSKILLAFGPEERLSKLNFGDRGSDLTLADVARVQRELDEVRRSGMAWDIEDYAEGLCAVGVPVRDSAREVVASLSVIVPECRFDADRREFLASEIKNAADAISRELGFRE